MKIGTTTGTYTTTTSFTAHPFWSEPEFVKLIKSENKLELVYKEYNLFVTRLAEKRVFKIEYTRIEGDLWRQSDRIYGEITPAQEESYKF